MSQFFLDDADLVLPCAKVAYWLMLKLSEGSLMHFMKNMMSWNSSEYISGSIHT